jgi:hypothetical protein
MILRYGLMSGGGIGEYIDAELGNQLQTYGDLSDFAARYVYDLLFFVIVLILLLNVIFGIIIDKFGELRDKQSRMDVQKKEFCFVCGFGKPKFDAAYMKRHVQRGFRLHCEREHNMYVDFWTHWRVGA